MTLRETVNNLAETYRNKVSRAVGAGLLAATLAVTPACMTPSTQESEPVDIPGSYSIANQGTPNNTGDDIALNTVMNKFGQNNNYEVKVNNETFELQDVIANVITRDLTKIGPYEDAAEYALSAQSSTPDQSEQNQIDARRRELLGVLTGELTLSYESHDNGFTMSVDGSVSEAQHQDASAAINYLAEHMFPNSHRREYVGVLELATLRTAVYTTLRKMHDSEQ